MYALRVSEDQFERGDYVYYNSRQQGILQVAVLKWNSSKEGYCRIGRRDGLGVWRVLTVPKDRILYR